jgi:dienelactone hydrolase
LRAPAGWLALALGATACAGRSAAPPPTRPEPGPQPAPVAQPAAAPSAEAGSEPPSPCTPIDTPFTGLLCLPTAGDGQARHPAMVLFGGYGGDGEARRLARELATRGYVTAAVSYFGAPGSPHTLVDVPVEIGVAAVTALAARPDVDPARVAVLGSSKGGEYALLVAATTPAVKKVIANVPSPFAWYGLGVGGAPSGCSWSRAGRTLPCVPPDAAAGQEAWRATTAGRPIAFRAAYEAARRDSAAVERAFFPLERIQGPVLCLAAGDDEVWNSSAQCELAMTYLRAHHHPFPDQVASLVGAGHLYLMAREGPDAALNSAPMGAGGRMAFGGTPLADARAAQTALALIDTFLSRPGSSSDR